MAPTSDATGEMLAKRQYCSGYMSNGYCYSTWSWWGRWVFLGIIIAAGILLLFLFACFNSRRRRRRGTRPMYGTGWMAPSNQYGPQQNNPNYYQPPPAYGQQGYGQSYPMQNQYTGTTFRQEDGYYGQHEGIQQPKNVYGNDNADNNLYSTEGSQPPKIVR